MVCYVKLAMCTLAPLASNQMFIGFLLYSLGRRNAKSSTFSKTICSKKIETFTVSCKICPTTTRPHVLLRRNSCLYAYADSAVIVLGHRAMFWLNRFHVKILTLEQPQPRRCVLFWFTFLHQIGVYREVRMRETR